MTRTASSLMVIAGCTFGTIYAQTPPPEPLPAAAPLSFEVVSIKPAPPGTIPLAPLFMRDRGARILGLQRMQAPVWVMIGYAYSMQKSEGLNLIQKQPDWVKNRIYTVTFRAKDEPTRKDVREMMRTMLADRFALQIHDFTREGTVNKLVMNKPGVLGPNLKPHPEGAPCTNNAGAPLGQPPDPSNPSGGHCGFTYYPLPGMVSHVEITDTTMAGAAPAIADLGPSGLETRPLVDATGLTGKYDLTLEYRSRSGYAATESDEDDSDVPTLIQALQQQLGIRVESAQGPVRMFVIDHIATPTPD